MTSAKRRKIHIELPERVHQQLRVKAALGDISIQKCVEQLITEHVEYVEIEKISSKKEEVVI